MELTTLTTWVDGRRKLAEQLEIEVSSGKAPVEEPRIHAGDPRHETRRHDFTCQRTSVGTKEREQWRQASASRASR